MEILKDELVPFLMTQGKLFEITRVVNPTLNTQYTLGENGALSEEPHHCYSTWNKEGRCENCISSRVLATKNKLTKFEFVGEEVYFVLAYYVEIDDKPYVIELVTQLNDEVLFDTYRKSDFAQAIEAKNKELYFDSLTGARSRRFYDERVDKLDDHQGVVVLDVDNLKEVNDTYGHQAGDELLIEVVRTIASLIRSSDSLIRIGGDEFLLLFPSISKARLEERLEEIRRGIFEMRLQNFPDVRSSISIGAVFAPSPSSGLFQLADKAMYTAKKVKNSVIVRDFN